MEFVINLILLCLALWFFITRFIQFGPRKSFVYFYGVMSFFGMLLISVSLLLDGLGELQFVNWSLVMRLSISLILFNILSMLLCLVKMGGQEKQKRIATRLPVIGLLVTPLIEEQYYPFFAQACLFFIFFILLKKKADVQMLYRSFFYPFILSTLLVVINLLKLNYFFINNLIAVLIILTIGKMINDLMVKDYFSEKVNVD